MWNSALELCGSVYGVYSVQMFISVCMIQLALLRCPLFALLVFGLFLVGGGFYRYLRMVMCSGYVCYMMCNSIVYLLVIVKAIILLCYIKYS